ncbi:MAG: hypothetical protein K6T81_18750 [Alicyclobacillus macrosporangiidus]|uniref:hypothetical protein n=1 Tax=Alicyclobacillus macrosporangiidus TaxID=392015 RepID=UPI0026F30E96|nr:hypothetical protein [Alicyclobacillus macrosporangiidus]MCL6600750.1 hypothetical protein [Alicyclobacillus macrosporangiidus]
MSVIAESREGDPIVFIVNVVGVEVGMPFSWERAHEFHIGDVVYYVDEYKDSTQTQDYLAWMIKFRTQDGKIYSAVQTCFVTMDEWQDIVRYFADKCPCAIGNEP